MSARMSDATLLNLEEAYEMLTKNRAAYDAQGLYTAVKDQRPNPARVGWYAQDPADVFTDLRERGRSYPFGYRTEGGSAAW